jgi:hypothetical protein
MARLVAAVPKGFAMTREDARFVNEFIDSLFPVRPEGLNFDLYATAWCFPRKTASEWLRLFNSAVVSLRADFDGTGRHVARRLFA